MNKESAGLPAIIAESKVEQRTGYEMPDLAPGDRVVEVRFGDITYAFADPGIIEVSQRYYAERNRPHKEFKLNIKKSG